MKYFVEGLLKKQIKVLKALGPHMAPKGFYLAGGTALAIHYGHRISVDLDWFSPEPFEDGMLLAQALRKSGNDFLFLFFSKQEYAIVSAYHGQKTNSPLLLRGEFIL